MKPFYTASYIDLVPKVTIKFNTNVIMYIIFMLVMFSIAFIYFNILILIALGILCIVSMLPTRNYPFLGIFDLNIVITTLVTVHYGLPAGLFVGNFSVLGNLLIGDMENIMYDITVSNAILIVPFLLSGNIYLSLIISAVLYSLGGLTWNYIQGTLELTNICWFITNTLQVIVIAMYFF